MNIEAVWNKVNKGAEIKCCSFQATMLSWHFAANFDNNISQTKMFSILLLGLCGTMCPLNFAENSVSANQLSTAQWAASALKYLSKCTELLWKMFVALFCAVWRHSLRVQAFAFLIWFLSEYFFLISLLFIGLQVNYCELLRKMFVASFAQFDATHSECKLLPF